jgi:hypothetical protein
LFIPVPDWLDAGQSDIPAFGGDGERETAGSGRWYTLHVHRQMLMVLFLLYYIEKSYVNAGIPEKSLSGIGISSGSMLPQSGIGIPASGFSPVQLVTD